MKSSQHIQSAKNTGRRVSEWGFGCRIAAPIVVFFALMFGNTEWIRSGLDAVAASEPPQTQGTADRAAVYFPSQYTNQATAVEAHIEAF